MDCDKIYKLFITAVYIVFYAIFCIPFSYSGCLYFMPEFRSAGDFQRFMITIATAELMALAVYCLYGLIKWMRQTDKRP